MCDCYKDCCEDCWWHCDGCQDFFRLIAARCLGVCPCMHCDCASDSCESCCYGVFPCCRPKRVSKGKPYIDGKQTEILPLVGELKIKTSFKTREMLPKLKSPSLENIDFSVVLNGVHQRESLCKFWTSQGQGEHASIASFALYTQNLMAIGAPNEIIKEAFLCGQEEMEHARLSFQIATIFKGEEVRACAYQPHSVQIEGNPEKILISTLKEGCIQETLGCLKAIKSSMDSSNEVIAKVWIKIAIDEAYHASYAWRVVIWIYLQDPVRYADIIKETINKELMFLGKPK